MGWRGAGDGGTTWGVKSGMAERARLRDARRVVVKVGSRALVRRDGSLDTARMRKLADDWCGWMKRTGGELIVVSSGAIACGLQALGIRRRPEDLASLQMAAAVGQSRLMAAWEGIFGRKKRRIAQVLLTHADVRSRERYLNALRSFGKLLENGVVPIVNENDVVATEEIKFGDNDALASRTAMLTGAQALVLLTTVNGFLSDDGAGRRRRVPLLPAVTQEALGQAKGKGSAYSTGGMASKLGSAAEAAAAGTDVVIANGRKDGIFSSVMAGEDAGTLIPAAETGGELNLLRRWVRFFHRPEGALRVDAGAEAALRGGKKSLLPVGVTGVDGRFAPGDLVEVRGPEGRLVGHGLARYSSETMRLLAGMNTEGVRGKLGASAPEEAIHVDYLILADQETGKE